MPTKAFSKWFDDLKALLGTNFINSLRDAKLLLPDEVYSKHGLDNNNFTMEVSDFNSLIAISQDLGKPVFSLTADDIKTTGAVARNQEESVERFRKIYEDGARKIMSIAEEL